MTRRGNCWDDACSETRSGSLKVERLHGQRFAPSAMQRTRPLRGCSDAIKRDYIERWLMSVRCSSKANGLLRKPTHELGYGIRNPGTRSNALKKHDAQHCSLQRTHKAHQILGLLGGMGVISAYVICPSVEECLLRVVGGRQVGDPLGLVQCDQRNGCVLCKRVFLDLTRAKSTDHQLIDLLLMQIGQKVPEFASLATDFWQLTDKDFELLAGEFSIFFGHALAK